MEDKGVLITNKHSIFYGMRVRIDWEAHRRRDEEKRVQLAARQAQEAANREARIARRRERAQREWENLARRFAGVR